MSSTTEARTFKGQHGKPTGRRPVRSRTKAPSMQERECADERGEKRQQGQGPRVAGRKQDRDTELVSKATGRRRRRTRSRKATSAFSQARDLLELFGTSNFRVPNGSRYHIVIQAHGARVTWSTSDREPPKSRARPPVHDAGPDDARHALRREGRNRPGLSTDDQQDTQHPWDHAETANGKTVRKVVR